MGYRPIIGISGSHDEEKRQHYLKDNYFDAVLKAGGLPVVLPRFTDKETAAALLDHLDGLLLAGGGDILPARFGEETLPACGAVDDVRDVCELHLTKMALERRMPVFGICRGVQVLAVALGGTLFQDIESQLGIAGTAHRQEPPYDNPHHTVRFKEGGLFERITGTQLMPANSMHHQSIKDAGPHLKIEGITMDGIVEAVCMKDRDNVLGVQFHPEYLAHYSDWAERLFTYFVEKARQYHG